MTPTSRGADALGCLNLAVAEAARQAGLEDLRNERVTMPVPNSLGAVVGLAAVPIAVVSGNGPCFRSETFAQALTGHDPLLRHVRTRVRPPRTNGAVERFFGTLKYEHLYRAVIGDGDALSAYLAAAKWNRSDHLPVDGMPAVPIPGCQRLDLAVGGTV